MKTLEAENAWSWEPSKLRTLEAENPRSWERSKLRSLKAENAQSWERSKLRTLKAENPQSWERWKLKTLEDIWMSAQQAISSTVGHKFQVLESSSSYLEAKKQKLRWGELKLSTYNSLSLQVLQFDAHLLIKSEWTWRQKLTARCIDETWFSPHS